LPGGFLLERVFEAGEVAGCVVGIAPDPTARIGHGLDQMVRAIGPGPGAHPASGGVRDALSEFVAPSVVGEGGDAAGLGDADRQSPARMPLDTGTAGFRATCRLGGGQRQLAADVPAELRLHTGVVGVAGYEPAYRIDDGTGRIATATYAGCILPGEDA